ncbi:MAG: 2TM domain-containing protein [Tenacibaculum sp.]
MKRENTNNQHYLLAKKRVEKIKGFYWHLLIYIFANTIISLAMAFDLIIENKKAFIEVILNFKVYSFWFFWGIGLFFHFLKVYGTKIFFSKTWEKRKIKEIINKSSLN